MLLSFGLAADIAIAINIVFYLSYKVSMQNFPLRGKPCYLKIKRRKWLHETTGKNISRDWHMVATGTRMTEEFALFLKRASWIQNL
ncbi:ISAon1 family transposase N-terminal region protein [Rapidithrix thailandica]|uniref:ISAon1 family transposase N-terminal region protein n=1 Tax=Rapidithrix thailandica TaxID=413964 RepID=UPI003216EF39